MTSIKSLAIKTLSKLKWILGMMVIICAMIIGVFCLFNSKAVAPLMTKTDMISHQNITTNPPKNLNIYIDHSINELSQNLILSFNNYHQNINITTHHDKKLIEQSQLALFASTLQMDNSFAYGFGTLDNGDDNNEFTLFGVINPNNTDNSAAKTFRDFLLSSPAQDKIIAGGFDSIEPYRNLSHPYFANTPITKPNN